MRAPRAACEKIHANTVTATPAGVSAFVAAPGVKTRTWHAEATCPHLSGRTLLAFEAATLLELVCDQARGWRKPCQRCALDLVWDGRAAQATLRGYHYLSCHGWNHGLTPGAGAEACTTCASLRRYASRRNVLYATTGDERVTLLLPGCPEGPDMYPTADPLGTSGVTGDVPASVTAPMWAFAAKLLDTQNLSTDLHAAAALHGAPATQPAQDLPSGRGSVA